MAGRQKSWEPQLHGGTMDIPEGHASPVACSQACEERGTNKRQKETKREVEESCVEACWKSGTIQKPLSQTPLLLQPLPPPLHPLNSRPHQPRPTNQLCRVILIRVCVCLMPHITSCPVETTEVVHPGGCNRISS